MVDFRKLTPKTLREQIVLMTGFVAIIVGVYFFIIEPLDKKTLQLQLITDARSQQLLKMQTMANEILNERSNQQTEKQLLSGKITNETLESGKRLLRTHALGSEEGKKLLRQLATHGKVAIYSTNNSMVEVLFWAE